MINEVVGTLTELLKMTVNKDASAVSATVVTDFAFGSAAGMQYCRTLWDQLGPGSNDLGLYVVGGETADASISDSIISDLPPILGATTALVLVFVGLLYRSIFIPLRGVLTIAGTLALGFALII